MEKIEQIIGDFAQMARYHENHLTINSGKCPQCGSEDITGGPVEIDDGHAYQDVDCSKCDAVWRDEYTLHGMQLVEEGSI